MSLEALSWPRSLPANKKGPAEAGPSSFQSSSLSPVPAPEAAEEVVVAVAVAGRYPSPKSPIHRRRFALPEAAEAEAAEAAEAAEPLQMVPTCHEASGPRCAVRRGRRRTAGWSGR